MITKDSIETAYSFLHQKRQVYIHSQLDWQKDDIEYAIASYVDDMSQELYDMIANGRNDFLRAEFTVTFATLDTMVAADYVGIVSGRNAPDKMQKTGWTIEKAPNVNAPLFRDKAQSLAEDII